MESELAAIGGERRARQNRLIAIWLLTGVVMTVVQIALGGITRLTGSGLSITEWEVVTGSLPPLNEGAWLAEFDKYKATPQFRLLNADFSLADFKFIFFWEWFHRLWARLIGLVFAVGFIYFLVKKYFQATMVKPLVLLFVLGALQGAVGWIMVASGLTGDAVFVKPTRLALHFIFAMGLLSYTYWFYLSVKMPVSGRRMLPDMRRFSLWIIGLLAVQLIYGALMAGHKAASAAPPWPDINGAMLVPAGLFKADHGIMNLVDNKIMVHFIHRGLAYLLAIMVIVFALRLRSGAEDSLAARRWWWPLAFILVQVILGIASVLSSTGIVPNLWGFYEWMAQLHQLVGMSFLLVMVQMLYLTSGGKKPA